MRYFQFFLSILLIAALIGCTQHKAQSGTGEVVSNTTVFSNSVLEDQLAKYFDWDMEHRPTTEEIEQISLRMSTAEVVEVLGKPHNWGPTSGVMSLCWVADTGDEYYFVFLVDDNAPDRIDQLSPIEQIMTYGLVASPANLMGKYQH